jgi:signal transduction histidine kinase
MNGISTTSSGIRGMRERALAMGGRLEISSQPGEGTRLALNLPLNQS